MGSDSGRHSPATDGATARRRRLGVGLLVAATAVGGSLLAPSPASALSLTVTTLADGGPGSLRAALDVANQTAGTDTITFGSGTTGTIVLTSGQLQVLDSVIIVGPGQDRLTIDAGTNSRVMDVQGAAGSAALISGLTLANGLASGPGGGLRLLGPDLELKDVTIRNSKGTLGGGVAAIGAGRVTMRRAFVTNNGAGDGGGVYVDGAAFFSLEQSVLLANTAAQDGAGLMVRSLATTPGALAFVTDSVLAANQAGRNGGGLANDDGTPVTFPTRVENTTITANRADGTGGAAWLEDAATTAGTTTFTASTVAGNAAGAVGGLVGQASPKLLQSTVVADNTGADLGLVAPTDPPFALDFSLVESAPAGASTAVTPGSNIVGQDPQLGPLGPNGGPLFTMAPAYTSPLVDHGRRFAALFDARGSTRPVDLAFAANAPGGDGTDIGAVELAPLKCLGRRVTLLARPGVPTVGTPRDDIVLGTPGNDRIRAGRGNDRVCGLGGNDRVGGGAGDDRLSGDAGNDRLAGNGGDDRLLGGDGRDRLSGGGGNDRLRGGQGRDKVDGGPGRNHVKG